MTSNLYKTLFSLMIMAAVVVFTGCGGGTEADTEGENTEVDADGGAEQEGVDADAGEEQAEGSEDNDGAEVADGKYECPMKCENHKTYAEAGACDACGMDLVLIEGAEGEGEDAGDGHEHGEDDGHNHDEDGK